MSPEDVPRIPEYPIRRAGNQPAHLPTRWTMQYFEEEDGAIWVRDRMHVHHNTDLFPPEDLTEWPSDLIDMLYGCLVMYKWGTEEGIDAIYRLTPRQLQVNPPNLDSDGVQIGEEGDQEIGQVGFQYEGHDPMYNHLLGDTTDGLVTVWKRFNLRREPEKQYRPSTCFQEKVSDWLRTQ
ncbi:hypothetical protein CPB86DRAFT_419827 [Serendipita vermifera]|nr:hypothetical protein CPB86DRAFT_419827 [Serendipita vermifera]